MWGWCLSNCPQRTPKAPNCSMGEALRGLSSAGLQVPHLPVQGPVLHELVEAPQHPPLEGSILIAFQAKPSTPHCLGQAQLQEQDQVRLGEAHVRLLTPVQGEVLWQRQMVGGGSTWVQSVVSKSIKKGLKQATIS